MHDRIPFCLRCGEPNPRAEWSCFCCEECSREGTIRAVAQAVLTLGFVVFLALLLVLFHKLLEFFK